MEMHVPHYLKHQYNLYDRNPKIGITNRCNIPEKTITIDNQGNCLLCICDGWLPVSVGHIMDFNSFEQIWQSEIGKKIQKDVAKKNFTWCSVDYCGIKNSNQLMSDYSIGINIDESCNLRCPTCRDHLISFTSGKIYQDKLLWSKHIVKLLEKFDPACLITMSGNGDPFASLIYRPILMNIIPKPQQNFRIMTNGLLLKKLLKKTAIYDNITHYSISVDAGDQQTYEKVRINAKWETLIENLDFLKSELSVDKSVCLNFCLHKENLDSLDNFLKLVEKYQWSGTIQPMEDWGFIKNFQQQNILDKQHVLFPTAVKKIKSTLTNKNIHLVGKLKVIAKDN